MHEKNTTVSPIPTGWSSPATGNFVVDFPENRVQHSTNIRLIIIPICPDLLELSYLGMADTWRGRAIRGFFRLLHLWPVAPDRRGHTDG